MASLLDLARVARKVKVGDDEVDVYGVSAQGFAELMARFPEIGKMMAGITVDAASLGKLAPEALGAFIAAGTGNVGSKEAEEFASKLGMGSQMDLISEILRLTFPRGVGPFVKQLDDLSGLVQGEAGTAPPPSSQGASSNSSK